MSMYEDISISNYTLVLGPPYVLPYALKDITGRTGPSIRVRPLMQYEDTYGGPR